jgi:sterol desaturase/sphingolipid hydroxylase (fatty acid hydroxylase superfamily)
VTVATAEPDTAPMAVVRAEPSTTSDPGLEVPPRPAPSAPVARPTPGPGWSFYVPGLVVAAVTIAVVVLGVRGAGPGPALLRLISGSWARMLGPAVLGFVAAVVLVEQVRPAVRRPLLARGQVQDLLYLVLYATAVVPLVVLINVGFSRTIGEVAPWLTLPRLAAVPTVAVLVVAVLLMDFCNWLAHWANHRWTPVWRFHAVHHSQEELSVLTSFRAHPLVHTSFLISVVPVVILSSNATLPATVITVYICLGSLPHANLRWTFGPLGRWIVSPAYHRLHHASEGRIDVNLGTVFTFWDVLTRRAVFPVPGAEPIATGLRGRPVPVEQDTRSGGRLGVFGVQLVEPFVTPPGAAASGPAWAGPRVTGTGPGGPIGTPPSTTAEGTAPTPAVSPLPRVRQLTP